jgi:glycerol-3-phosphate acyltransferase PlsX
MADAYSRYVLNKDQPTVGLLSIGEEETKGTEFVRECHKLLSESNLQFKGNIEGRDIFAGNIDVIVCDGFVGNVVLKVAESIGWAIADLLKAHLKKNLLTKIGAIMSMQAFKGLKRQIDYAEYGGAQLLGVDGRCIICHGSSNAKAIKNAINVAAEYVEHKVNQHIVEELEKLR